MIYESAYWKEPLIKTAKWLVCVRLSERTQERTFVRIEKEVFLSFYSIRKLIEALKVSDNIRDAKTVLAWHPNLNHVHHMNWEHIDLLYDLNTINKEERDVLFLCNQFIHSFVFSIYEQEGRIGGFYVTSDFNKNRKLYRVSLDQVVVLFRLIGRNYPSQAYYRYFYDTNEYESHIE